MSEQELIERVRAELQRAHARVVVPPGSAPAAVRTAHRRRRRRRILAGTGAIALVSGGLLVATRSGDDAGTLVSGDGAPSSDAPVVAAPVTTAPASKAPPTAGPSTTTPSIAATMAATMAADVPSAQLVESAYRWEDVTPPVERQAPLGWVGPVPGVVVGSDASGMTAYYTADGIAFDPLDPEPPSGSPSAWLGDGDALYAAGAEVDGEFTVDVSADRGTSWRTVLLPVDVHALDGVDHITPRTGVELLPTDGAPLVSVRVAADLDLSGLDVPDGFSGHLVDDAGVTFMVGTCGTPIEGDGVDDTTPCDPIVMTWEQLGVGADAVAALRSPLVRLFDVSAEAPREVAPPPGYDSVFALEGGLLRGSPGDGPDNLFRYRADGWEPVEVPPGWTEAGVEPYPTDTRTLGVTRVGEPSIAAIVSEAGTFGLAGLFPETRPEPRRIVAAADTLAVIAELRGDALADGPIEVTSGSVVVQHAADAFDWSIVDTSGTPIDGATIEFGAAGGGFAVLGPDGTSLATFDQAAYDTLLDTEPVRGWSVLTTTDAEHVAADDLAELLAVDGTEIADAAVHAHGDGLVVTVVLADGTIRTLRGVPA